MPVLGSWYTFIWEKNTLIKNWIFISPCRFFLLLFKYMNFLLCTTILYPIFYPEKFFQLGASPDSKTRTSVWYVDSTWVVSRWQRIQGSKQTEIELISKKVWIKDVQNKNWMLLRVQQYKNCCWRECVIRKCIATYTEVVEDHNWSSYVLTITKQNSLNKTTNKLNIFKKKYLRWIAL